MKHKHAELIKAWADGAKIQVCYIESDGSIYWSNRENPAWDTDRDYRIKPEPKPDWGKLVRIETHNLYRGSWAEDHHNANLRLTFDGETNKLKSAEVLK
jgi:hypothetical protein